MKTHDQLNLLMNTVIKKENLEAGKFYFCDARNFSIGKWNGTAFEYKRLKFGDVFTDIEYYFEDEKGTVYPLEEILEGELTALGC